MKDFTLDDFKAQMQRILNPGLLERAARFLMTREMREILADDDLQRESRRNVGIVDAMTSLERLDPKIIDFYRVNRIARGAGVSPTEVLVVLKQYETLTPVIRAMQAKSTLRSVWR